MIHWCHADIQLVIPTDRLFLNYFWIVNNRVKPDTSTDEIEEHWKLFAYKVRV